jgi:hypothetical protein
LNATATQKAERWSRSHHYRIAQIEPSVFVHRRAQNSLSGC